MKEKPIPPTTLPSLLAPIGNSDLCFSWKKDWSDVHVFLSSYWNPCICICIFLNVLEVFIITTSVNAEPTCIMMDTQFVFSVVSKILVLGRSLTKVSQHLIYPLPCCHSNWLPWQRRWNLRWNVSSGESAACMLVNNSVHMSCRTWIPQQMHSENMNI